MKRPLVILLPVLAVMLLTTGCYTKFYRPGMEQSAAAYPQGQLYNPTDSSAIDTTLTAEDWDGTDRYPSDDYGWNYWGRPRTRWGFDFYGYDPSYYWSYYGYYDYYSRPWWHNYYDDPWRHHYPGGGGATPAEPPSRRPGRRGESGSSGGGGTYAPPPAPPSSPSAVAPPPSQPQQPNQPANQDGQQKRPGRRGG